jgi:hypothetical protein
MEEKTWCHFSRDEAEIAAQEMKHFVVQWSDKVGVSANSVLGSYNLYDAISNALMNEWEKSQKKT